MCRAAIVGMTLLCSLWATSGRAMVRDVSAGGDELTRAMAAATPGDVLRLAPGIYRGSITIVKPLTLEGGPGAVIDAGGTGRGITVVAPDVTLRDLTITGSGTDQRNMDAGILLDRTASRAQVVGNHIIGNLYGVYVQGPDAASVEDNEIVGRMDLPMSQRGNGITVWNSPGTRIVGNRISGGRDGIFSNASRQDIFQGNTMDNVRFAIHYMYTNDSKILNNTSTGNDIGFALMFSDRLVIDGNISKRDRQYGMLLNYANDSIITRNTVLGRFLQSVAGTRNDAAGDDMSMMPHGGEDDAGALTGTGKCVFIYNANKNRLADNHFEGCEIGIHFTAGAERNVLTGNAFIANRTQVMYVGTRSLDWSDHGRGNYWSDNPAFDLNGDGIADEAYRPNDLVDRVVWRFPAAKLLLNSPAIQVIRWAQSQFPALHPGGVIDTAPLMKAPGMMKTEGHPAP